MNPLEKIQRDMKIVELVKGTKQPLYSTFRKSHSFTMPIELCELLSLMRSEYNVNVSAEMEPVIKRKALQIVRRLRQKSIENPINAGTSNPASNR